MESEVATRMRRIDSKLVAAGWSVVPYRSVLAAVAPSRSAVEE
jgi:hypothetical protein